MKTMEEDMTSHKAVPEKRRSVSVKNLEGPRPSMREVVSKLVSRKSMYNIGATIRTVPINDGTEGKGFIYKGASEWGSNFPEANGDSQSPININSREAEYDVTLSERPLTLNYVVCRETGMCNNGHTVSVQLHHQGENIFRTEPVSRSTVSGGPLLKHHEFELAEFRFHWGREDARGSEHTVNFKAFPMELHLFHWNSALYSSLEDAMGKPNGLAIIALFVQVGREHTGLKVLTENIEDIQHKGRQKTVTSAFHPNCLLPDPMLRDFWTYTGSLTSPPCCENVTWIIFRYPLTMSRSQIEEFRRLRTHPKGDIPFRGEDGILVDNFRPTQPLNDRVVKASFQ